MTAPSGLKIIRVLFLQGIGQAKYGEFCRNLTRLQQDKFYIALLGMLTQE